MALSSAIRSKVSVCPSTWREESSARSLPASPKTASGSPPRVSLSGAPKSLASGQARASPPTRTPATRVLGASRVSQLATGKE
jgi:hypothetical protein